jgi:hypothetical protein
VRRWLARRRDDRGQALVEFSIVLIPFLFLLMGVIDLGRGIYVNNGVTQAAREIAGSPPPSCVGTSCTIGTSLDALVIAAEEASPDSPTPRPITIAAQISLMR